MNTTSLFTADDPKFNYVVTHVFFPPALPKESDFTLQNELSLARAVCTAARAYNAHIGDTLRPRWRRIARMLDNLQASLETGHLDKDYLISQFGDMEPGDILVFFIRSQHAAAIFRRQDDCTLYESFEASPSRDAVMRTGGRLLCSYAGTAVDIPNKVFDEVHFQTELANFLSLPGNVDSVPPEVPAGQPGYITTLLTGILRSVGHVIEGPHILKRVGDEVGDLEEKENSWRRSPLWLLIRVAIQTSFDRSPPGRASYKEFMMFFICNLANDANDVGLASNLLHLMSVKILRRLSKLGSSTPNWMSDMVLKTCARLRDTLDSRTVELRADKPKPYWNPSELDLVGDTQLSLPRCSEYVRNALADADRISPATPFHPKEYYRGMLEDFLSSDMSFFEKAYSADPYVALYDVELSVEKGIDHWVAHVTNVDEACMQLVTLMDSYLSCGSCTYLDNPELRSIMVLTALELWVALDTLVVAKIPILAEYSSEIPMSLLESLLLRETTNLHRLSRVYLYLSDRRSVSRAGLSVLSDEFTEDSFPVRYYDNSHDLQDLRHRMEGKTISKGPESGKEHDTLALTFRDVIFRQQDGYNSRGELDKGAESARSLVPIPSSHIKVISFELHCPLSFRIWRSAILHLLYRFDRARVEPLAIEPESKSLDLLHDIPEMQPHLAEHWYRRISACSQFHLAFCHSKGHDLRMGPRLRYAFSWIHFRNERSRWCQVGDGPLSQLITYYNILGDINNHAHYPDHKAKNIAKYAGDTIHTSNDVLASQSECHSDFSLDEFIACGHLRSGGSLQWLNILRELRGRTFNFYSHEIYFFLAQATSQVGPFDVITRKWVWHQELQDLSFCNALLNELEILFLDTSTSSLDEVTMRTITMLLTPILASSPCEDLLERALRLLRDVRRKTFAWVQELAYNLMQAPTDRERCRVLFKMATTCRCTFDVSTGLLHRVIDSAEDVEALLACAFFIRATNHFPAFPNCEVVDCHESHFSSSDIYDYSRLIYQRDHRLSVVVEGILRNVIETEVTERGIDLAVGNVWPGYHPGIKRWKLEDPHSHWLVCATSEIPCRRPQDVRISLLDGSLLVDSRPVAGLPHEIRMHPLYRELFFERALHVIPSDLPGMDFATLGTIGDHFIHFSLRHEDLVIQTRHRDTADILELIPRDQFKGELPTCLVEYHDHWLNPATSRIHISPIRNEPAWEIVGTSGQYRVCKDSESMVDMKSRTWAMVSGLLKGLDDPENLVITVSTADSSHAPRLSVAIPRHGLSFFLTTDGDLESEDFREMIYDKNQDIGTLFGLDSRLVLRGKTEFQEGFVPRCVLIPTHRFPDIGSFISSTYHVYKVDTDLGRLAGPGFESFDGKQFLSYLHAMTSIDWRPDLLTAKTGAQEALSVVASAHYQSMQVVPSELISNTIYPYVENAFRWYPQIAAQWYSRVTHNDQWLKYMRASLRAEYLFPHARTSELPGGDDMQYLSSFTDFELEDPVHTAALLLHRRSLDASTSTNIALKWSKIWGDSMSKDITQSPSPYGVLWNPDLPRLLPVRVHDIFGSRSRDYGAGQQFRLLFLFPTQAYCSSHPQTAFLSMLLAFAKQERHCWDNYTNYNLLDGYSPTRKMLRYHIHDSRDLHPNETKSDRAVWHNIDAVVECLLDSWPSNTIPTFTLDPGVWDVESLTLTLQALFSSFYRNWKLMEDLTRILQAPHPRIRPRAVLHMNHPNIQPSRTVSGPESKPTSAQVHTATDRHISHTFPSSLLFFRHQHSWRVTLDKLLSERQVPLLPHSIKPPFYKSCSNISLSRETPELDRLLSCLPTQMNGGNPPFLEQYVTDLHASARYVRKEYNKRCNKVEKYPIRELKEHFVQCKGKYMDAVRRFEGCLGPTDNFEHVLVQCGQWPQITSQSLLRCLASTSPIKLSEDWRHCLLSFALLLLEFQRSRRLLRLALEGLEEEFMKELEHEGCDGWNVKQYPDWLLLQLEGNFLVRREQANTALEMISPQSGENTVMQVNMGEGKSSVIIPIVAAALADGRQLARVIVPKGLMIQMLHLLSERLGGFVNRRVYCIPFTRPRSSQALHIETVCNAMSRCMEERGILLVRPEDVLSLKLTSIESQFAETKPWQTRGLLGSPHDAHVVMAAMSLKYLKDSYLATVVRALCDLHHSATGRLEGMDNVSEGIASQLLDLQRWLHSRVRDIFDESDEILHARHQLIYTIGDPQHMEGYPDRWTVIQKVLRLVKHHASSISKDLPHSVDCRSHGSGSFPYFRILQTSDAGRRLISLLVKDVMDGRLSGFDFRFIDQTRREAMRRFLSADDVGPDITKEVERYARNSRQKNLWNSLLLLRGLFASNILLFCLTERRWRVDYGLIPEQYRRKLPSRTNLKLAVPYQAKDVPALDTQFGHPDVTILLTCLSYYYTGLGEDELRLSFQTLQRQDNPAAGYALWVQEPDSTPLSPSLQTLREFNLEPSEQWDNDIFPTFAYNQATIDFYLSHVVFPKEAKEYPWRLAASSWDLAEKRERLITGFSGTNDSRYLLPTTISPWELEHQQGASARVLAYLLQQENDSYVVVAGESEDGLPGRTSKILKMICGQEPRIRVLLDVGAQIMDVSNEELASDWMDLTSAAGAVYFDQDDRLMVLAKNGTRQPLLSSSLAERLDRCVVYLDHAHTRGTDLKFPNGFRAVVTLGPKVTKDRLVQGCMRMRKLGRGHSVMFFAPLEVDQSIRSITHKEDRNIRITTADILKWAIHETWTDIQQRAPQWVQQGMSHKRRYDAWSRFCNDEITSEKLGDAWLEPETKSLAELYAPRQVRNTLDSAVSTLEKDIDRHCETLGVAKSSVNNAKLDEQVERQVNREIERERQVELPPKAEPAEHSLHPDLRAFVTKGVLRESKAFRPIFTSLEQSSISAVAKAARGWSPFILATADFCETIKQIPTYGRVDQYLRPVQWVLSGNKRGNRVLVILSPYEANTLIPDIRVSKYVHLHVYTPRTSWRMKPTDDLTLYTIPPVPEDWTPPWDLIDQLNIFAGQLYLTDWDAYMRLTRFLDLCQKDKAENAARFNLFNFTKGFENAHSDSLLPSVMMLLAIRRKGLPFSETHMGKILQGLSLTKQDFNSAGPAEPSDGGALGAGVMQLSVWSKGASHSSSDVDRHTMKALSELMQDFGKPATKLASELDSERMRADSSAQ